MGIWKFRRSSQAKFLCSLYIDDLADVIREGIDPNYGMSRYAEKLSASAPSFDGIEKNLNAPKSLPMQALIHQVNQFLKLHNPGVLALTAPFPGNVLSAFLIAKTAKEFNPKIATLLGGGYANTELRDLKEPRVFKYFDFICLDDGERPLECVLEYLQGKRKKEELLRTHVLGSAAPAADSAKYVQWISSTKEHDVPFKKSGTPNYAGLNLGNYLSLHEMLNPMHRMWSDGRWNKLTLAHGCYWKKCNFCDVTLDYIGRYDSAGAELCLSRMCEIREQTGTQGFHFVDEAAPPALLKALSTLIVEKSEIFTWWGNIRFEKAFQPELCELMARAGCVAVSGGLEVASDRLLELMNKGVSVEQVARVTKSFSEQGILVHAYLMYGFPTQTVQETVDSLERVRQL